MIANNLKNPFFFAAVKHQGQVRKLSGLPYFVHPLRVYALLKEWGMPETVAIAGLLHDVLEDTETNEIEIINLFGEKVAKIVKDLSKNVSGDFDFENAEWPSLVVKTADTLSNLEDTLEYGRCVSVTKLKMYLQNLGISYSRIDDPAIRNHIKEITEKVRNTL